MMKRVLVLLMLFMTVAVSAQEKSKSKKVTIDVKGNCEMCKKRIEKAAFKAKGVKYANWDVSTQQLSLIINERKTDVATVQGSIAAVGHDAGDVVASKEAYKNLHACCKYSRKTKCKPGCEKACCKGEAKAKACSSSGKSCCAGKKKKASTK